MKPSMRSLSLNSSRRVDPRLAWILVAATLCWGTAVRAAEENANSPGAALPAGAMKERAPAAPAAADAQSAGEKAGSEPSDEALSPEVKAVVKMADAGVSTSVIETFIECSPTAPQLTEADIIGLKKHKVPDEIVTALLKRGAKARALIAQKRNEALARALANRNARFGGLDPESYDYFRYYYLQPRALASAYQRLYPYYGPWSIYPYGPPPAYGFPRYRYGRPGY